MFCLLLSCVVMLLFAVVVVAVVVAVFAAAVAAVVPAVSGVVWCWCWCMCFPMVLLSLVMFVFDLFGFHVCLEFLYVGWLVQRLRFKQKIPFPFGCS